MALSNVIAAGAVGVGLFATPLASTPTSDLIHLRAIAANPAVVAALRATDDAGQLAPSGYDELWELRLLGLEQAARSR